MKTFPHVEDYLEVINGDRNPDTGKLYGLFESTQPIVSLARYDVQVLSSMSAATSDNRGLTDRQAELAVKIILKYQRQLEKLGIDVSPVESPKFRNGIRTIDRRRILTVENDHLVLKFPYETKLIDGVRELAKISEGTWRFDSNSKTWILAMTELNVIAAAGFAANNQFEIDASIADLVKKVTDCEAIPYEIKLIETDAGYTITNADLNMLDYINEFHGGFGKDQIVKLVDVAPMFGYTVDGKIKDQILDQYSNRTLHLLSNREIKFSPQTPELVYEDLIRYAEMTNRLPIYIYEPDLSYRLYNTLVKPYYNDQFISKNRELSPTEDITDKKVVYFTKYNARWDKPIPLLISTQGMMHGGEKTMLLQRAEKVVYFATEVYNKYHNGTKKSQYVG